jgi:hypothetical protein
MAQNSSTGRPERRRPHVSPDVRGGGEPLAYLGPRSDALSRELEGGTHQARAVAWKIQGGELGVRSERERFQSAERL